MRAVTFEDGQLAAIYRRGLVASTDRHHKLTIIGVPSGISSDAANGCLSQWKSRVRRRGADHCGSQITHVIRGDGKFHGHRLCSCNIDILRARNIRPGRIANGDRERTRIGIQGTILRGTIHNRCSQPESRARGWLANDRHVRAARIRRRHNESYQLRARAGTFDRQIAGASNGRPSGVTHGHHKRTRVGIAGDVRDDAANTRRPCREG